MRLCGVMALDMPVTRFGRRWLIFLTGALITLTLMRLTCVSSYRLRTGDRCTSSSVGETH
jgi:hypothetical protein